MPFIYRPQIYICKTNQLGTSNRVNFNGVVYEGVDNFKYLGSIITNTDDIITDIKMKLPSGNRCLRDFDVIFKPRDIKKKSN